MSRQIPKTIRFHGIDFDVWQLGDGRFAFDYQDGSARKVIKRKTLEALRTDAERIATQIATGNNAAKAMTADDHRIYVAARETLTPLRIDVDQAARILAEASALLGNDPHRVIEAARYHARTGAFQTATSTADVVAHYIRHLSSDGVSALYLGPMEADLRKFADAFKGNLAAIRSSEMEDWLREMDVGLRRRRNLRDKLVGLFNFARDNDYLPSGLRTEAEKIKRPKVTRKAPKLYTPEELDVLITQCFQPADESIGRRDYSDFIPYIVIGAFAGLRSAEIKRLEWKHVHWTDNVIEVGEENKTGYRLVPIQPNLMSWLAQYRGQMGPVCPFSYPDRILRRLGERAGLPTGGRKYANALRHSFVTYRVAATKNMPLVSTESGHSVAELRKSYHRASLEQVAEKWWSITRDANNVVQPPLLSFGSR